MVLDNAAASRGDSWAARCQNWRSCYGASFILMVDAIGIIGTHIDFLSWDHLLMLWWCVCSNDRRIIFRVIRPFSRERRCRLHNIIHGCVLRKQIIFFLEISCSCRSMNIVHFHSLELVRVIVHMSCSCFLIVLIDLNTSCLIPIDFKDLYIIAAIFAAVCTLIIICRGMLSRCRSLSSRLTWIFSCLSVTPSPSIATSSTLLPFVVILLSFAGKAREKQVFLLVMAGDSLTRHIFELFRTEEGRIIHCLLWIEVVLRMVLWRFDRSSQLLLLGKVQPVIILAGRGNVISWGSCRCGSCWRCATALDCWRRISNDLCGWSAINHTYTYLLFFILGFLLRFFLSYAFRFDNFLHGWGLEPGCSSNIDLEFLCLLSKRGQAEKFFHAWSIVLVSLHAQTVNVVNGRKTLKISQNIW